MLKGMKINQKTGLRMSEFKLSRIETFGIEEDAEGGDGGLAGMKNDGNAATEDCTCISSLLTE